jgi:uncharacterized membrane protein YphA (DoxX/SURF4 family)
MLVVRNILAILGRVLLCAIFLYGLVNVARNREKLEEWVVKQTAVPVMENGKEKEIPQGKFPQMKWTISEPQIPVLVCAAVAGLGCLLLILGYKARVGALLLLATTIFLAVVFDAPWKPEAGSHPEDEPLVHALAYAQGLRFLRDAAIVGALLFILANGAGAASLDKLLEKPKQTEPAKPAGTSPQPVPQAAPAPRVGDLRGQRPPR